MQESALIPKHFWGRMNYQEVIRKLDLLRQLDQPKPVDPNSGIIWVGRKVEYKVFGAHNHKYELNERLTEEELKSFESEHEITLPTDYRGFLLQVGDGGAGPGYGLFPLQAFAELYYPISPDFLKTPFPHVENWNVVDDEDYDSDLSERYWNDRVTGSICLCHQGCGYVERLVVNGKSKGEVWGDSRVSDHGIFQLKDQSTGEVETFSSWYNNWLDESLRKVGYFE